MKTLLLCPDCGGSKWLSGPCGGLAQNIKCAMCGSEFNDLGPFGLERIDVAGRNAGLRGGGTE